MADMLPMARRLAEIAATYPLGLRVVVETTNRHGRVMGYRFDTGLHLLIQYTVIDGHTWALPEQVRPTSIERHGT